MAKAIRACFVLAASLHVFCLPEVADAASEVSVGGYHEEALRTAQRRLIRDAEGSAGELAIGGVRISVDTGGASAVTGFTPRFAGLGRGQSSTAAQGEVGALLKARLDPSEQPVVASQEVRIGPRAGAEIAGFQVNWAAIAEVTQDDTGPAARGSGLLVGGELALSAMRFDASIGQQPDLLGLDGQRVTAGLAYDFGAVDARLGYSRVEEDETATETSLFTLGSRLNLRPGLIVQGDLAYAPGEEGDPAATAGLVSLRFSF